VSTIFALIEARDADGIRELVRREPEAAAARDENGLTVVMRAAYRGSETLAAVREADPPLDAWDRIMVGEDEGLPAPDAWSSDGFAPLHLAAYAHNPGAARALIAAGADLNAIARASFATVSPLGTAATFGAVEVARLLLERGADTEATSDHGFTPLHAAASNGNRELAELLLAYGALKDARNDADKTPADLAADDDMRSLLS
jgi:uncharacterized protein